MIPPPCPPIQVYRGGAHGPPGAWGWVAMASSATPAPTPLAFIVFALWKLYLGQFLPGNPGHTSQEAAGIQLCGGEVEILHHQALGCLNLDASVS